jgi:maleylpyruvate isomerase
MKLTLYNYWRSSSSWRVRIALAHKQLDYRYVPVNLLEGEQHAPEFVALSPRGEVPLLEIEEGGGVRRLSQSLAICELLDELYRDRPQMLPKDPWARAQVRELVLMIATGIQPLQGPSTTNKVKELGGDERAWNKYFIGAGLLALEQRAKETSGKYLHGDAMSLADACLVPQLFAARRFGVELGGCTTLLRVEKTCSDQPAFIRAHAERQVDTVR